MKMKIFKLFCVVFATFLLLIGIILHHKTNGYISGREQFYSSCENQSVCEPQSHAKVLIVRYEKDNSSKCYKTACNLNYEHQPIRWLHNNDHCDDIVNCVTVTIKTRYRYKSLIQFIDSLQSFYPGIKIVIADEINDYLQRNASNKVQSMLLSYTNGLVTYIQTQPGVAHGRHLAALIARSKYIIVADDDYIITERTNLTKLLEVIENTDSDIVAGETSDYFPYAGTMRVVREYRSYPGSYPRDLYHLVLYPHSFYEPIPHFTDCYQADIVKNFFIADREVILKAGSWDPERVFYEHIDFFIQMRSSRVKVGICRDVLMEHPSKNLEPSLHDLRRASHSIWYNHLLKKWGIDDYYTCPKEYYENQEKPCPLHKRIHFQ